MSLSRQNLATVKNYTIDLITFDAYTYSIQISDTAKQKVIAAFPLDPMDRTLVGVLEKEALAQLGDDATELLQTLSQVLPEKIGAKELVIRPADAVLPGYVPVEQHPTFKRLRHASFDGLYKKTKETLDAHSDLVSEFLSEKKVKFVAGMERIVDGLRVDDAYQTIHAFLEDHANFTAGKMQEYKGEDIRGKRARFNNARVIPAAMIDSKGQLCGLIRMFVAGYGFVYLSDETVNQELIPVDRFSGHDLDEKKKNRSQLLLAYLIHSAIKKTVDKGHFLMIAADGREAIYDAIGMQTFPIPEMDYVVTMKFGAPGPVLTALREALVKPFSQAEAVSTLGVLPAPVAVVAEKTEEKKLGLNQ